FTYLPNLNYTGPDTFTYHVHDATVGSDSNTAMVIITVRAAGSSPTVMNDNYTTDENTALTTTALDGVLGNDTGTSPLSAAVVSGPLFGTLSFGANGAFIYTPSPNFSGLDSFIYIAKDGPVNISLGMATINVRATPTIIWADPAEITYGTTLGATQLN